VDGDVVNQRIAVGVAVAAALALTFWLGQCGGRRYERALAEDRATDVLVAHTDSSTSADSAAWQRERDSLANAARFAAKRAAAAKRRADSLERVAAAAGELVPKAKHDAAIGAKNQELAAKDAVIAQDSIGIRARDDRIAQLWGTVVSYRDTLVPTLTRERDRWRARAHSACGLGGTVGLGLRGADAVAGFTCRLSLPRLF
jgi:hypothetical protein